MTDRSGIVMTRSFHSLMYATGGIIFALLVAYYIWIMRLERPRAEMTPSDKLEAVIQSSNFPDPIAMRLRLLRDMPAGLTMEAARDYLQLPKEFDGGFDDAANQCFPSLRQHGDPIVIICD